MTNSLLSSRLLLVLTTWQIATPTEHLKKLIHCHIDDKA